MYSIYFYSVGVINLTSFHFLIKLMNTLLYYVTITNLLFFFYNLMELILYVF